LPAKKLLVADEILNTFLKKLSAFFNCIKKSSEGVGLSAIGENDSPVGNILTISI
jgi:hypothetical protein